MFDRFLGKKETDRLSQEIAPYRNMAIDNEVDQTLADHDLDLTGYNRHLLTSNDRFQLSTAYLALARSRAILMGSMYDKAVSLREEVRTQEYDPEAVANYLITGFKSAKHGVEAADDIYAQMGYTADKADETVFMNYAGSIRWPGTETHSSLLAEGGIEALENILATVFVHYTSLTQNSLLPNDFRLHLQNKIKPILARVDASKKAIDRIFEGTAGVINSRAVMEDIYKEVQEAYEMLEEAEIWLCMPRLKDVSFTLREPLNENKPKQNKFDPSIIARPIVPQVITPPQPKRPFTIESLTPPPAPVTGTNDQKGVKTPDLPKRSFDPSMLSANSSKSTEPEPGHRGFDPSILRVRHEESTPTPSDKSFQISDLGNDTDKHHQKDTKKSFSPADLDNK
jgi:hypothetical protein